LNRKSPKPALPSFTEYFQGFERVEAVRSVFGDRTEEVLGNLRIGFIPNRGMYMGIRDVDGHIAVGTYHLKNSPVRTLYLDIVHELFHINQRMTDEKYFHKEFMKFMQDRSLYYASPIEIPAYEYTVREAERIGMSPEEILEYLKIGESPPKIWRNFLKEMKLKKKGSKTAKKVTKFPVKIKRDAESKLYPFVDYFGGFGKVQPVKELFGDATEDVLGNVKVEFIDSPFPTIYPSEDDGHLIVANDYFREGAVNSVYLDTFLCLNLMKAFSEDKIPTSFEDEFGKDPRVFQAYAAMVKEGRRLGLSDAKIQEHLQLPRFLMSATDYRKFLKALRLKFSN
jgi:predicted adenine nucleotide alpha hydrolase (AANH) superfamily ATPase